MQTPALIPLYTDAIKDSVTWKLDASNLQIMDTFNSQMQKTYVTTGNEIVQENSILTENGIKINELKQKRDQLEKELEKEKNNKLLNQSRLLSGKKSIDDEIEKNKRVKIYIIFCYLLIVFLLIGIIHIFKNQIINIVKKKIK